MKLHLEEKKDEVPGVITFIFKPEQKIDWKAGQFLHYVLHHRPTDDRGSDRWFTISSAPFEEKIKITTRFSDQKSSTFKDALKALNIGDVIEVADLDGDFIFENPEQEYVFIAGGIGITPFYSILKQLEHEGKNPKVTLLYGNRNGDVVFKTELEEMAARNSNFKSCLIIAPEKIDEETIKKNVPDLSKPVFYISGPEAMVESLGKLLKELGVDQSRIRQDWFPGYEEI